MKNTKGVLERNPGEFPPIDALTGCHVNDSLFSPIHTIIEKHARDNPDAPAVRYHDEIMTYSQLNKQSNRLAHALKEKKVGFNDPIIVCLEPSTQVLVTLLGILKAGATYIPVDPGFPTARIQVILNTIKPILIISEENLITRFSFDDSKTLISTQLAKSLPDGNLEEQIHPEQTAYIFHTSGSTGVPKAVMASHANLSYYMQAANSRYSMNSNTIMPALARFSFSISLFELLSPLVAGGTVWILDRNHVLDFENLANTLSQVTMFHAGPSLLKGLIAYIRANYTDFTEFTNVLHASSGGDMIPPEVLEDLKELFPQADIFVIYGSTEIACMGCTYFVPRLKKITKTYVGQPFPNTTVQLLDTHLNPVKPGEEGEVCFAGNGVAQGYLNQLERTEAQFVTLNGQRFYKMGDIGRLNDNNELELLGRVDFQIKIRGMRVEVTEVEYQLRNAPGVKDAVVAAKEIGMGEKTLIAYLVFIDGADHDLKAIHEHLVNHLPEYMIPSCYAFIDALPLNFNLKLDRKALPDPNALTVHRVSNHSLRLPITPTQKKLAALWSNLLGIKDIGLDSLFFELGGHSLLGVELLMHIKQQFGVEIEGMVVVREPLEIFALNIDKQLGQGSTQQVSVSHKTQALMSIQSFYFGPNASLYGVLHTPQKPVHKTVLLCGPEPYDLEISLFVIQQMAKRLAEHGIAVLQFHYYGTGDSAGDGAIESFFRWREDICSAQAHLQKLYPNSPMIAIGIRLGATLLWQAQERFTLDGVVFWDPIFDGKQYLEALQACQDQHVGEALYYRNIPKKIPGKTELLGTTYSNEALIQLQTLAIVPSDNYFKNVTWLTTQTIPPNEPYVLQAKHAGWKVQCISSHLTINWDNKIPDTGVSISLVKAVEGL